MLLKHLAIINESAQHETSYVMRIAAALQKQIVRDFAPIWKTSATVALFENEADVPIDYWKIIIRDDIGYSGLAGIHLDQNGQPYALIDADENIEITCSHEALEMLADPFGREFVAGPSPKPGQGRVNFLVEVCDPSEAHSYTINGIRVSDFYTPDFFAPVHVEGLRYSFMNVIKEPRQVLAGGYISWMVPATREWWQLQYFLPSPQIVKVYLDETDGHRCWRQHIDCYMRKLRNAKK